MKVWATFVGTQLASRNLSHHASSGIARSFAAAAASSRLLIPGPTANLSPVSLRHFGSSRLFSSSSGSGQDGGVQLRNIGKEEMEEILEDYEAGGREESGYLVLDVRELHEVEYTGKLSPNTQTLPLQLLAQQDVFALDEDEFEEVCGFPKPTPDETLVFSCAAGIRSVHAAQFAAVNGYTQLVNYSGGANQWFS
jgi:rhodanese-related sulfurtransferase